MQTFTIDTVLNALLNQQERPLEDVLGSYFSPDYRQRTDGAWDDRQGFAHHARKLRELIRSPASMCLMNCATGDATPPGTVFSAQSATEKRW